MNPSNATSRLQAVYGENEGGATDPNIDLQPMMGLEFASLNGTVTLTNAGATDTATVTFQEIKKKCRIMGARVIGQAAITGGTAQVYNDSDAVSNAMTMTTSGSVVNASSIAAAYSTLNPGDFLKVVFTRTATTPLTIPVSVLIDLAPIGNL